MAPFKVSIAGARYIRYWSTSGQYILVKQDHPNYPDALSDLISPLDLFQILSEPSEANQCTLSLCMIIPRCFESTYTNRGAFRILWKLSCRIISLCSNWHLCIGMWETSRTADTCAQLCRRLGALFGQQWLSQFHRHKAFSLSYLSLLQSYALLNYNMACISIWVAQTNYGTSEYSENPLHMAI
jgi:hypothetical protein